MNNRKVILYISMSLDGFIATNDDDLSWLSCIEKEGEDYGYQSFTQSCDTYIVGKKTYDVILELTGGIFPQIEMFPENYIITRQEIPSQKNLTFYNGDIEKLIYDLKSKTGKNIYCDGGAEIVKLLMEKDLIDEYIISVIPIFLGDGKRLFKGGIYQQQNLKAHPIKQFDSGLIQLHYTKVDKL